jgi:hypothetical protein
VVEESGRLDEGKHGGLVVEEMNICMVFYVVGEVNGRLGGGVDSGGELEVVVMGICMASWEMEEVSGRLGGECKVGEPVVVVMSICRVSLVVVVSGRLDEGKRGGLPRHSRQGSARRQQAVMTNTHLPDPDTSRFSYENKKASCGPRSQPSYIAKGYNTHEEPHSQELFYNEKNRR